MAYKFTNTFKFQKSKYLGVPSCQEQEQESQPIYYKRECTTGLKFGTLTQLTNENKAKNTIIFRFFCCSYCC